MKTNVGSSDRVIRFVLGAIIIALGFYFNSWWGAVGVIPIITGLINFCPAYNLMGLSTKKKIETEKLKV
jgi:hypothetical protein